MVDGWENRGQGSEELSTGGEGGPASINSISSDGSRIFFENECTHDLYMRRNGNETIDLGEYKFHGANPEGTEIFVSKEGAGNLEFFSINTESNASESLFSVPAESIPNYRHMISEDGNVVYFGDSARLAPEAPALAVNTGPGAVSMYRYDIPNKSMTYITQSSYNGGGQAGGQYVSANGRDYYFASEGGPEVAVPAVPGGQSTQTYRYDSLENVVQCMSCASPFNSEPEQESQMMDEDGANGDRRSPLGLTASTNGNYAFFSAQSELVPQDIDGETPELISSGTSTSSDVYQWRRNGVDGCNHAQGCLALITNGIDGTKNELLGTTPSGRDVFIATHSELVPEDKDTQGDVYDARIGGGFPPPPLRPVECEGDACHNPPNPPNDPTPSSATYEGPGNEHFAKPKEKHSKRHHKHLKSRRKRHRRAHRRAFVQSHGGHQ